MAPSRHRAGHDLNYTAISGALALNAIEGQPPTPYGVTVADLSGAMLAGIAILSAMVGSAAAADSALTRMWPCSTAFSHG